ncbi:DUF6801 domain-containing protein [Actinokineospora iranica]|uniref:DUF6801 domain-containing protein n=1 Tax=Actinokineospora iranica TaxID=1271860 RepID=A0A1G6LSM8_9PSEU|nr:DUF6801 domain-containing protein [Actinokineospora iranica]SDC46191.1 hypothetical protein SAMN05216174_102220 [Actinokineospora iranica]
MATRTTGKRLPYLAGGGVVAVVAALFALMFGVGSAAAVDKELTYKGAFPLIGEQTVSTVVHVDIPEKATAGETLSVPFSIDVDAGEATTQGLQLVGAKKLSGGIKASVTLTISDGQSVQVPVELPIPETAVPTEGTLKFTAEGSVDFTVPAGVPAGEATTKVDPEAVTHVVTDSSLGEFDVNLSLAPPEQDTVLGKTQVG